MQCVTDTSPLSWLARIGRLDILPCVYERIYAPPLVLAQLAEHYPTKRFVENHVQHLELQPREQRRFERLVRRWFRKLQLDDPAEVEVFVAYRFFTHADEMLYANKEAEHRFKQYGKVRDICALWELAESAGIYRRQESVAYLESLLGLNYRPREVQRLLERIS